MINNRLDENETMGWWCLVQQQVGANRTVKVMQELLLGPKAAVLCLTLSDSSCFPLKK